MNARRPFDKDRVSAKPLRKKRLDDSSYERRILEKSISDEHILTLVEEFFRSRTIGLINQRDRVHKSWLDVNDAGDIMVKFLLIGPPVKKEIIKKKGVKLTVFNGT